MPATRVSRRPGVTIYVEATAEVMFTPEGAIGNWSRQFSNRVTGFTSRAAPRNSRPTWGHEPAARGKSLKRSFTSSSKYAPAALRVYSAVGSTAPYAGFVDQGTGIYAGNAPWEAKILPPTRVGGSDLYEHTWHPPPDANGNFKPTGTVEIKGQRPQFFFARGLDRAFKSVHLATASVPAGSLSGAVDTFPSDLSDKVTASTTADAAFMASLTQWRLWRDEAFFAKQVRGANAGALAEISRRESAKALRRSRLAAKRAAAKPSPAKRAEDNRRRQAARRARLKETKTTVNTRTQRKAAERSRFIQAAIDKYGAANVDLGSLQFEGGYWYLTIKERATRSGDGQTRPQFREIRGRKVD